MKTKLASILLSGALIGVMGIPAMAAQETIPEAVNTSALEEVSLPDSVLYYGEVIKIIRNEDNSISQLLLNSEFAGEYCMNVSEKTVWIDSGNHSASDPSDLKEGERLYVHHSSAETLSLPPQSAAFAIVRNIPQDIGCAQYHEVESVEKEEGALRITTDNGGLFISADNETGICTYSGDKSATLDDIQPGDYIMAWYNVVLESYPGQTYANYIMLLDNEEIKPLTRAGLVNMLYNLEGKPAVDYFVDYSDVEDNNSYIDAIRWASSGNLISGYGNGCFGPDDAISREQMIVILWRYCGSPMLMDYIGLSELSDVEEISVFAQLAMAWAHQRELISADENGFIHPKGFVMEEDAKAIINLIKG